MIKSSNLKCANLESGLVLEIARGMVYGNNGSVSALVENSNIDWDRFKNSISYHGLVPFAYIALRKNFSLLQRDLLDVLEATYYYSLAHIANLQQKFLEIHHAFEIDAVDFIPIKGVALLEDLYPDCPVRSSTDVDVLVKESDLDKAVKILETQGYSKNLEGLKESYWRNKQYHFVFVKQNCASNFVQTPLNALKFSQRILGHLMKRGKDIISYTIKNKDAMTEGSAGQPGSGFSPIVELHWDLDYPRYRRHLLPQMFDRLRPAVIQNRKVKLLSVEDTFFGLALHQRRFGIALSLRDVCDIAKLLHKYKRDFDWQYVLCEAKKAKVCSTIFFSLCQVKLFFNIEAPEYVLEGLDVPQWKKWIIQRFISKNTFALSQNAHTKNLYLKAHFLLYDNLWEPVDYILNIPQEQFCRFYGLSPYTKRTEFLYRYRLFYIFYKAVINLVTRSLLSKLD